jgi:uncharacterized protein YraI
MTMRLLLAAAVACCLLTAQPARGEQSFPYKAHINANEVHVRSGPGQSYYATDKLKIGQEIEVYRHDPGGWYAIRPAEDTFSWIAAKYLKPTEGNLAVVTEENVAARVGARGSELRDVIQVRLHKGEVVELLDSKNVGSGPGGEKWCKIAPPSGEFRWVYGKYVDPDYPRDGLRRNPTSEGVAALKNTATAAAETANADAAAAAIAVRTAGNRKAESQGWVEAPASPAYGRNTVAGAPVASGPGGLSPQGFQAELDAIDTELAIMLVEQPDLWAFDVLGPRAEALVERAETAVERGRARVLLSKLMRFNDLKQRYEQVAAMREETQRANTQLARLSPPRRPADPDGRFDGAGRLTEVRAPKIGAPRYALVDEDGKVRSYVTPAPGISLRPYLGRQVTVTGTRGYMPEQRAQHLTARRVAVVEEGNAIR